MSIELKVPRLGEKIKLATVAKIYVVKGAKIKMEQPVVELEAEKAVVELPSNVAGVVDEVCVQEGDEVKVGQVLFRVLPEEGA